MKTSPIILILMLGLVVSVGCAKPDWIQQTLVTVDVTGTWRSTEGTLVELVLEQQGPKVKGSYQIAFTTGTITISSGTIEGTVTGDVFQFRQTSSVTYGSVQGEMTVSGDEMSGELRGPGFFHGRRDGSLRRIDSSPPPRSQ
jgi:hypothetical protein